MKRTFAFLLTVICISLFTTVNAQTLDELQTKYIAALGGKEKIKSLKTVVQEGNMEVVMMGMKIPAKTWIVYGEASRQEIDIQGQKMITFIGKDKGWMINPLNPAGADAQPLPDEAVKSAAGSLNPGGEFYDYKENGYTATYDGKDSVDGKPAYKVTLSKGDYTNTIFLDAATYYISKTIAKVPIMGKEVEQTTYLKDYKKTPEGYVFPHASSLDNPMAGEIKISITKIEVNGGVDVKELEKTN